MKVDDRAPGAPRPLQGPSKQNISAGGAGLTLFGVWRHLLHESDEVEQELGVVAGQLQLVAVFPRGEWRTALLPVRRWPTTGHWAWPLLPFVYSWLTQRIQISSPHTHLCMEHARLILTH
jgi:hypothetical protein